MVGLSRKMVARILRVTFRPSEGGYADAKRLSKEWVWLEELEEEEDDEDINREIDRGQ